ncbi:hypothetical protein ACFPER_02365 [Agromyces aurantiacus]|uniref:Extracellular solute-binding protein n=1 Tax=Agromyces aurantiacus TaxID=165814 RepID=A0ABV9R5L6_9MICO|nr:hypothetical protein [Agromyces aurantiacus]MBM7505931.1 TRAP-type C4-dicarboxylate transport system substrate-binding protein [Agromyces aurantiacus]
MPIARRSAIVAGAAAVAVVLAGCGQGGPVSKAGPGAVPQTIVIGLGDSPGRPVSDDAERLADLIAEYSEGALVPEIRWNAHTARVAAASGEVYPVVGDMVVDGAVDLALTPDFVWIERGAMGLAAVKTPFLITEQATMDAVATGDLGDGMLGELDALGVVGLALLPESLRHPIGFADPFLEVADFDGATVRSLDPTGRDLVEAFGGTPSKLANEEFALAVAEGRAQGADSSYAQIGSVPRGGTFTGDVTWYAKFNTAVANADWFDGLAPALQEAVRRAADDTVRSVVESNPTEAESAATFCAAAGSIAHAGREAVAAFEAAARPVRERLEADPVTREAIAAIEALQRGVEPAGPVAPCELATDDQADAAAGVDAETAAFPEGTYRAVLDADDFLAAGVDESTAYEHAGVWSLTFEDGTWVDPGCPGSTYRVRDGRVTVRLGPVGESCGTAAGAMLFSAEWTFDGETLRFTDIIGSEADGPAWQAFHEVLWGSRPWRRVE